VGIVAETTRRVAVGRRADWRDYSMRMPEMARLITNCWICSVPSKGLRRFLSR
jgi:hypothetical protein